MIARTSHYRLMEYGIWNMANAQPIANSQILVAKRLEGAFYA